MAASVARCGSVNRTRAGQCDRRILFSAIRYSFWSRSCWFTIPVTYANSRATCVFFIQMHHHILPIFSMRSNSLTLRECVAMPADQSSWFHDQQCTTPVEPASQYGEYKPVGRSRGHVFLLSF